MSHIGLVLGGGGVTGAAFHFGALLALQMATGWDPNDADLVVGTSSGAVVGTVVRSGRLDLAALVGDAAGHEDLHRVLAHRVYRRRVPAGFVRWIRHSLVPGITRPGIRTLAGSPALHSADGIVDWLREVIGDAADAWPERPILIPAYELESRSRVVFGDPDAPRLPIGRAAAASSAVPVVFQPVPVDGRHFVDGGVLSGTHADLVLRAGRPLDLILVVAPMASLESRPGAGRLERTLDRLGAEALAAELESVRARWPGTEVVVLRPDADVLSETRPNPLSTAAAVPVFLETLRSMQTTLADRKVWPALHRHVATRARRDPPASRDQGGA
jgi:NTE family protein